MAYFNRTTEVFRGDIFFVSPGGNYYGSEQKPNRPGIVVSNDLANKHSPNVEMVFLTSQEKKPLPTHVEVVCKVPSIALCENIQTVSKDRLGDFVKSCTTSEMQKIDKALLISLGIEALSADGGGLRNLLHKSLSPWKLNAISTKACMNSF